MNAFKLVRIPGHTMLVHDLTSVTMCTSTCGTTVSVGIFGFDRSRFHYWNRHDVRGLI